MSDMVPVKTFEFINHTADTGVVAYGNDIKQAFANAAMGLFSLIIDLNTVVENLHRDIKLSAEDQESLLVGWLNELIYTFDVEHIIFKKFEINRLTRDQLQARCFGERVDLSRHKLKTGVKAATYHMLKIERDNGNYRVQVIFDI